MFAILHRASRPDPEHVSEQQSLARLGLTVGLVSIYSLLMLLVFAPAALRTLLLN